jgi:hypothetical protein
LRYTLYQLTERLEAAGAFPTGLTFVEKRAMVNEALEAAILCGRWNGTQTTITINVAYTGIMTLPRPFLTAKAVRVNGIVRPMASPWYNFLQNTSDTSQWSTNIQDLGDGFCVFKQPKAAAQLRFACSDDNSSTVEVHGKDATGAEIYTGSPLTQRGTLLTFNAAKAAPYFTTVTEIIKPETKAQGSLYACYDDGTEEVIGLYDPGETTPSYRAYLVQEVQVSTLPSPTTTTPVAAFVQRRHVDLVDNDIVPISNLRAMKNLVRHIHWENEADETRSEKALNAAIAYLNMETKQLRAPGERGGIRVDAQYAGAYGLYSKR